MDSTPLDDAKYISLRSYRRDGAPVDTPVWQAPLDGKLVDKDGEASCDCNMPITCARLADHFE